MIYGNITSTDGFPERYFDIGGKAYKAPNIMNKKIISDCVHKVGGAKQIILGSRIQRVEHVIC